MSKVLLIDDATLMRNLLRRILTSNGYEVCAETADGVSGLEKYRELRPDLVFCDLSMPLMDGMECLRKILEFDPDAKVIICTSQGKENFASKAIDIGAKSYIVKPINAKEVLAVAERVGAGGGVDYKNILTESVIKVGLSQKDVLDFFDAFRSLTGKDMGDLSVDRDFLRHEKDRVIIGAEAFLSAKHSLYEINKLVSAFSELCE